MADLERLAGTVVGQVRSRLELLSVEWQEEKLRLGRLLLSIVLLMFFVQLGLVLVTMGLVVGFWDTPARLTVIVAIAAVALGAAWVSWRSLKAGMVQPKAFEATVAELRRDEQALGREP